MDVYVGNLPFETTESDLESAFGAYGRVRSVKIIRDRVSGNALGFAFVDMPDDHEAKCAIGALHGTRIGDRVIMAAPTQRRTERRSVVDADAEIAV